MKEFLRAHDIEFEGIYVEELDDPIGTLRAVTGGGPLATPTVVIDGEARTGFQPDWMSEQLGIETEAEG